MQRTYRSLRARCYLGIKVQGERHYLGLEACVFPCDVCTLIASVPRKSGVRLLYNPREREEKKEEKRRERRDLSVRLRKSVFFAGSSLAGGEILAAANLSGRNRGSVPYTCSLWISDL